MDSSTHTAPIPGGIAEGAASFRAFLEALRPGQWVKNGFIFAGLIFGQQLAEPHQVLIAALAAADFCLLSSGVYLVNDVFDRAEDRRNPLKCPRPVASGRLPARAAVLGALLLGAAALGGAWRLDRDFYLAALVYAGLNLAYSGYLKRVMLVDVFIIAAGFVLRVVGGAVVIHVPISPWLLVCTTLLALFLALSKRRHELVILPDAAARRASVAPYSAYFLDQLMVIVTASTVMAYTLYTLSDDVRVKFPGKRLELTVPFVLFGIFRYLFLVHRREEGGNPARLLFTDPELLVTVLLWAVSVVLIIYL